ncbi:hypothetical protein PG984_011574 [Apiospora sp. TS-2023a]
MTAVLTFLPRSLTSRVNRGFTNVEQALVVAQISSKPHPETTSHDAEAAEDSHLRRRDQRFATFELGAAPAAKQPTGTGAFERSPTFLPETYTSDDSRRLGYFDGWELQVSPFQREYHCIVFFQVRRQYLRIEAQLLVSVESPYWDILREKPHGQFLNRALALPFAVERSLVGFLRTCEIPDQGGQVSVHLGHQPSKFLFKQVKQPVTDVARRLQQISAVARYMDCPRYRDRELIHQNLCSQRFVEPQFIAWLSSRWVMEIRFSLDDDGIEGSWYTLQVLHCMKCHPRFGPLVGLVESDDGGLLGYLCEIPTRGSVLDQVLAAQKVGKPISWKRRQRWCRQLIEAVAELHSNGFVHGSLGTNSRNGAFVDGDDNLRLLSNFKRSFVPTNTLVQPPEYFGSGVDPPDVLVQPAVDLYHMGLLLWGIAANEQGLWPATICRRLGCSAQDSPDCSQRHTQLPSVVETAPAFMDKIIADCRAASPAARRPAWSLLRKFPELVDPEGESSLLTPPSLLPSSPQLVKEELAQHFGWYRIYCTRCWELVDDPYHCNACDNGDFDICKACFNKGFHCFDESHYLRTLYDKEEKREYFSSVRGGWAEAGFIF